MSVTETKSEDPVTCLLKDEIKLNVPLSIGALQWGTTWIDDKVINSKGVLTDETCQEIIQTVSNAGVTLYDTAEGYGGGTSEKRLGRLLSSNDNVVFMTKYLPVPWRLTYGSILQAIRGSCQRLGVKCIDIYLLHSPMHWYHTNISYFIECFARVHHEHGLIKAVGLSNCNAQQCQEAYDASVRYNIPLVCNQVHYSLLTYGSQSLQEMEQTCRKCNIKIIGYSPIGQGLLTDKCNPESFESNRPAKMLRLQYSDIADLRQGIQELSLKYKKTMAQIALNWCIQHNVLPLVGCRSVQQAKDSIGCLSSNDKNDTATTWSGLSKEDVTKLDSLALNKSTLESKPMKRIIFVSLFGIIMQVCKVLDFFGYGKYGVIEK